MKKLVLVFAFICFAFAMQSQVKVISNGNVGKESISIGSAGNTVAVPYSTKVVFRATDYIEITQNFELLAGSEMELITHPCPE